MDPCAAAHGQRSKEREGSEKRRAESLGILGCDSSDARPTAIPAPWVPPHSLHAQRADALLTQPFYSCQCSAHADAVPTPMIYSRRCCIRASVPPTPTRHSRRCSTNADQPPMPMLYRCRCSTDADAQPTPTLYRRQCSSNAGLLTGALVRVSTPCSSALGPAKPGSRLSNCARARRSAPSRAGGYSVWRSARRTPRR